MNINDYDLVYVASPYSKYSSGIWAAFEEISAICAKLVLMDINIYSPVIHSHPIAVYGGLDPLDHKLWLKVDEPMMKKADALLVSMMDSWQESFGVQYEIAQFELLDKPVYYLNPETMEIIDKWELANEQAVARMEAKNENRGSAG